jgi:hypothetical protein
MVRIIRGILDGWTDIKSGFLLLVDMRASPIYLVSQSVKFVRSIRIQNPDIMIQRM